MCNCFNETKEKISEMLKIGIGDHAEFDGNWKNRVFFFGENPPKIPVVLLFEISYREIKTNGEPYKNKTTQVKSVTMSFCPLCGEKQS